MNRLCVLRGSRQEFPVLHGEAVGYREKSGVFDAGTVIFSGFPVVLHAGMVRKQKKSEVCHAGAAVFSGFSSVLQLKVAEKS